MKAIFKRDFKGFLSTKTATVFAICFIFLTNFITFYSNGLLEIGSDNLTVFFNIHFWIYCFMLPAISMNIFAEESKKKSIEILFSLPISSTSIVIGKFLAAWIFIGICLVGTMTIWVTMNVLTSPDNMMILSGYIASFLTAGCFLIIGMNISAITNNQTVAFILTVFFSLLLLIIGSIKSIGFLQSFLPTFFINLAHSFDIKNHYYSMMQGVISGTDIIAFLSFIGLGIIINTVLLERKKA